MCCSATPKARLSAIFWSRCVRSGRLRSSGRSAATTPCRSSARNAMRSAQIKFRRCQNYRVRRLNTATVTRLQLGTRTFSRCSSRAYRARTAILTGHATPETRSTGSRNSWIPMQTFTGRRTQSTTTRFWRRSSSRTSSANMPARCIITALSWASGQPPKA